MAGRCFLLFCTRYFISTDGSMLVSKVCSEIDSVICAGYFEYGLNYMYILRIVFNASRSNIFTVFVIEFIKYLFVMLVLLKKNILNAFLIIYHPNVPCVSTGAN